MGFLFDSKKSKEASETNPGLEKIATAIAEFILKAQRDWALWMDKKCRRASRRKQKVIFALFSLLSFGSSVCIVSGVFRSQEQRQMKVSSIKIPITEGKNDGLKNTNNNGFDKIHNLKLFMDSLARSPSGRKTLDSLESLRPGLMDSVQHVEQIYQSQLKN